MPALKGERRPVPASKAARHANRVSQHKIIMQIIGE
jgi:hypothetical protein